MRVIITEDQLEYLKERETYKKVIFKYWDKVKPEITEEMLSFFGIGKFRAGKKSTISTTDVQNFLREYLGINKAKEIAYNFLKIKEYIIDSCGGYNFNFTIDKYVYDETEFELTITVDDLNGKVVLINVDGNEVKLKTARDNEHYGWEIDEEIEDCIYDYISKNIEDKTGLSFVIDSVKYKSGKK